jgi:hypothetical protein
MTIRKDIAKNHNPATVSNMFDLYSSNVTSREHKTTYESQKTRNSSPDIPEGPPSARGKELEDTVLI